MAADKPTFNDFFENVTPEPPDEDYRAWVKQQPTDKIEEWLLAQKMKYSDERIAVLRVELNRRREAQQLARTRRAVWQDRAWGALLGIALTLLTQYISK